MTPQASAVESASVCAQVICSHLHTLKLATNLKEDKLRRLHVRHLGSCGAEEILLATMSMSADEFEIEVKNWIEAAQHPRWKRLTQTSLISRCLSSAIFACQRFTGPTWSPVAARILYASTRSRSMAFLQNGVVGTAEGTKYSYGKDRRPFLTKEPKLLLNDNNAGKAEGIHPMIGRPPDAAFGDSTDDRQMLGIRRRW